MTVQNAYAIIVLLSAIVVFGACAHGYASWLIDIAALALALATPCQPYTIAAVAIVAIVRHSRLAALSIAGDLPAPALALLLPGALYMSSTAAPAAAAPAAPEPAILAEESSDEMVETPRSIAENSEELICFGENQALARLVAAGKIGLTEAVKIGAGAKSGAKYQRRSAGIKAAIEALENHYPAGSTLKRFD